METALVHLPVMDPTSGYHSICYLETYAASRGFLGIELIDANIEGLLYTAEATRLQSSLNESSRRLSYLEKHGHKAPRERREFLARWRAESLAVETIHDAITVLRSADRFYDYSDYLPAAATVSLWREMQAAGAFPGQFGRGFDLLPATDDYSLQSVTDLTDPWLLERIVSPYVEYFEEVLVPKLAKKDAVGLSITYWAQLPFALHIARSLRRARVDIQLWCGGTEVADVYKYLIDSRKFFRIFDAFDACAVGEGESAFVQLLEDCEAGRPPRSHRNLRIHPKYLSSAATELPVSYESLIDMPTPQYDKLPWELYLAPEAFVYYSPTRGCYWNKCTFCDYGLNTDSPTSPWRQLSVDRVAADMAEISGRYKHIYLSVDVLAPAMMLYLAEELEARGLDINWGGEIRLERYWSQERCEQLYRGGCKAVSVGFESGSQRILNLIDKGVELANVSKTVRNLSAAGVAVQMMGFTGFPSETAPEAMASVEFLAANRSSWTFGGLGEFVLTPGSIVAQKPAQFGITNVRSRWGPDIGRALDFDEVGSTLWDSLELEQAKKSLDMVHLDRPWLGGVDTPHSFMYHVRYGTAVVSRCQSMLSPLLSNDELELRPAGVLLRRVAAGPEGNGARHDAGTDLASYLLGFDGELRAIPEEVALLLQQFDGGMSVRAVSQTSTRSTALTTMLTQVAINNGLLVRASNSPRGAPAYLGSGSAEVRDNPHVA